MAISAPYEDDGVGAVYIYMGSKNGVQQTHSQRLSPASFEGSATLTRGFGLGVSRGNDIDGNGHSGKFWLSLLQRFIYNFLCVPDLAVGAYKSGEVFLFYGLPIIDYILNITTNVSFLTNGGSMHVTYCLVYSQRSPKQEPKSIDFKITLNLDSRTTGQKKFEKNWNVLLKKKYCESIGVNTRVRSWFVFFLNIKCYVCFRNWKIILLPLKCRWRRRFCRM